MNYSQIIGFWIGVIGLAFTIMAPAPGSMTEIAWLTTGVAILLASWWATEVLPIPVTSLLPLFLFPALGLMSMAETAVQYSRPTIFLMLGGFIISTALVRWNLHQRIALHILARSGSDPKRLIAGFMLATAVLSMWISNTASTLMMLPIAHSVADEILKKEPANNTFLICLLLSIAYAASIGGLGTPIGTPPNLFVVSYMRENYDVEISFLTWMSVGVPAVFALLPLAWVILTKFAFPFELKAEGNANLLIHQQLKDLGPLTTAERRVSIIFAAIATCWVLRVPIQESFGVLLWVNDGAIAIMGATALFAVPSGNANERRPLLDWSCAPDLPWGVLLLFGGGLSLAAAVESSGLALWLGQNLSSLDGLHIILVLFCMVTLMVFLTEMTSNTASTAALLPVLAALAVGIGTDPLLLFMAVALSASCAFMLPVATPPNAIVFSTGSVKVPHMVKAGFRLNLVCIFVVTGLAYLLVPFMF